MKNRQLIKDLFILAVLGITTAAVIVTLIEREWREISERYIEGATERAANEFERMSAQVEGSLNMIREWGRSGVLDLADVDQSKELVMPLFERNPMLSGISVADAGQGGFFLLRNGEVIRPAEDNLYTPSDRPWFEPALAGEACYWTGIYRFATKQQLGITASVSWQKDSKPYVAALDILLDDFFQKVQKMAPTPAGKAFIFLPDGQLYVPETASAKADFESIQRIKGELASQGYDLWSDDAVAHSTIIKMHDEGAAWWCGFVPLAKAQKKVWMGVLVPESDILGDIAQRRLLFSAIGIAAFGAITMLYIYLTRRSRNLIHISSGIGAAEVHNWIAGGENRMVEFKSTMRMNLHTKKPGKEIELAWMKGVAGFLNTDGGILLIGVTDDGEITGLERDVFENEDKCRLHFKNLVAKHIGADLSKHVRFVMVEINGKSVGVVRCMRSSEPVFLKDGNKEYFYIRNGPSSDELPVSKALNYIKHRK